MSGQVEAGIAPEAQAPAQPSDCTSEELAHGRYLDALHDLVVDASAGGHLRLLADVIAWTFARIAIGCGPAATGDMLERIGRYMAGIERQNEAKRELERAREEGRLTH